MLAYHPPLPPSALLLPPFCPLFLMRELGQPTRALTPEQVENPRSVLDTFDNPAPDRDYEVRFVFPEFTSICPVTGQPDFATFTITYTPDERNVEMKSLKLYFLAFRDKGIFYEAVTNRIFDDLTAVLSPRQLRVEGDFAVRGGTKGVITVASRERA
jgi:7-cyano-7-deazaguanine reductase